MLQSKAIDDFTISSPLIEKCHAKMADIDMKRSTAGTTRER